MLNICKPYGPFTYYYWGEKTIVFLTDQKWTPPPPEIGQICPPLSGLENCGYPHIIIFKAPLYVLYGFILVFL